MSKKRTLKTLGSRLDVVDTGSLGVVETGSWRSGKSSTARGYGYKWQKVREIFLAENPLCVYCKREGRVTAANVVDHIVPHKGDQKLFWRRSNWQALCASCHSSIKQAEERGS